MERNSDFHCHAILSTIQVAISLKPSECIVQLFPLCLIMVMFDNKFETKENKMQTKDKILKKPQQIYAFEEPERDKKEISRAQSSALSATSITNMADGKGKDKYSILLPTYNERENLPLIIWLIVEAFTGR